MKANFESIYTAADPRPYFTELAALDYQISAHAGRLFGRFADHLHARGLPVVRIADLCCSYGVNATVMKHRRDFAEIVDHYTTPLVAELDDEQMVALDRKFYGETAARAPWIEVVGIDVAAPAVAYAERVGMIDVGITADLESGDATPEVVDALGGVALVAVSGGIGYISERTIGRVLDVAAPGAWFAALCLRWVDATSVVADLERRGLVVERLDGVTFRQRRFADDTERDFARNETERLGLDPFPDDGYHHSDLYLARPALDVDLPLGELVDPAR